MKITCIDNTAKDRLILQEMLYRSFEDSRNFFVAQLPNFVPSSLEEIFELDNIEILIIGPNISLEESWNLCRKVKQKFPQSKILVFLKQSDLNLRNLKRFLQFAKDVFSVEDAAAKIIFVINSLIENSSTQKRGKTILFEGVKGGVGTTSIITGYAQAMREKDLQVVIIDLSPQAVLARYLGLEKQVSNEYTQLIEAFSADRNQINNLDVGFIKRNIFESQTGLNLLLSPVISKEVRELWLRSPEVLNLNLIIFDYLLDNFDYVLVDRAGAEGIYPNAIEKRADTTIFVSTNEPASIHLLEFKLRQLNDLSKNPEAFIQLNLITSSQLSKSDIIDLIGFSEENWILDELFYDSKAQNWVVSGDCFYAAAKSKTQKVFEKNVRNFSEIIKQKSSNSQKGSLTLEQVLFLGFAVLLFTTVFWSVLTRLESYSKNYQTTH